MFISYAQNFEDVVLWRALRHVEKGFYIDIGAQDPVIDSVSLAFYELGWRGVHVEPTATYAQALRAARPDETVIEAAVGESNVQSFYEIPDTGLSTGKGNIAERHLRAGFAPRVIDVASIGLCALLDRHASGDIHWLKIDVEGMEADVLRSWGESPVRPWIVVVEATVPLGTESTHATWEHLLTKRGYRFAYWDGLNRFYVSDEHAELLSAFGAPPNVFDEFTLSGTGSHLFTARLNQRSKSMRDELASVRAAATEIDDRLKRALDGIRQADAERDEQATERLAAQTRHDEEMAQAKRHFESCLEELSGQLGAVRQELLEARADFELRENQLHDQIAQTEARAREREAAIEAAAARAEASWRALSERLEASRLSANAERDAALGELTMLGQALAAEKARRTEDADRYTSIVQSLKAELEAIRNSFVWRASAPLRRLATSNAAQPGFNSTRGQPEPRPVIASKTAATSSSPPLPPDTQTMKIHDPPRVGASTEPTLSELLRPDGKDFVHKAYLTVLRRPVDPDGLSFYEGRLAAGVSKRGILRQLLDSPEAAQRGIALPALRAELGTALAHEARPRSHDGDAGSERRAELQRLLGLDGAEFVEAAYRSLLRREADAEGRRSYLDALLAGAAKTDVLAQLYRSSESVDLGNEFPELARAARAHRLAKLPVLGILFRSRFVEGASLTDTRLRRIEQRMAVSTKELTSQGVQSLRESARVVPKLEEIAHLLKNNRTGVRAPEGATPATRGHGFAAARVDGAARPPQPRLRLGSPAGQIPVIYFFVDHTVQCPVNTGMQRVVRRLARALLERGESLVLVKWNADRQQLVLASRKEIAHLAKWNGPQLSPAQLARYPKGADDEPPIAAVDAGQAGGWLIVPEVTHITYQSAPVTIDLLMSARRSGLLTAFIYYDAVPLRLPSYRDTAERHETYMQQLLFADYVLPISHRSADELSAFFRVHQSDRTRVPEIEALPLPAESQLSPRIDRLPADHDGSTTILSVGSIEPRKNQVALLRAFDAFCAASPQTTWRLVLAGHLRGDVASEVMSHIERNPRISHVQGIADPDLDALYRSCAFTVFPSIEEGFGLPILESLWYGKPCICADFGAMAEVAAGGGCYGVDTRSVDDMAQAIERLAGNATLRQRLAWEATRRPLTTWDDYAAEFTHRLAVESDPIRRIGTVYYWVDDTCINPSNSGIQRVTRQLAKALLAMGVDLVPIRWVSDENRFAPPSASELEHIERWEGPQASTWSPWREPGPASGSRQGWLMIPELTHGDVPAIRAYARQNDLKCAAIFYDAIPYKLRDDYGPAFAGAHRNYMREVLQFEKIFPISAFSGVELLSFYLHSDLRAVGLDRRIVSVPLPDEFAAGRRALPLPPDSGPIRILSVISIEPRKNPLLLLSAFESASSRSAVPLELTIVGRRIPLFDPLANEVELRISRMHGVVWEQNVNDGRLGALTAASHFTVFPSTEEGFGLPILESLWSGRPCICHDGGAMAEVAAGGGCLLVNVRDAESLTEAIVQLAERPELRDELANAAAQRPIRTWIDYATDLALQLQGSDTRRPRPRATVAEEERFYAELVNVSRRPVLSVCISTYNRGPWLTVALRNLARLIPVPRDDIEIVVCDNCSTDDTPDVLTPYLGRADFHSFRNPVNVGMLGNLRVTAHHARGRYIWILGDDDLPFAGSVDRILAAVAANPEAALVYLNYSYTREADATSVRDLDEFLASGTPVVADSPDRIAPVKELAVVNENLFTAIYCLVFRRDHALRAYSQDTSGRPFSTMRTSIPTTHHVLHEMMEEEAVWLGSPQVLVNFNVSWNDFAALQILERVPEALDVAELKGAPSAGVDRWRANLLPGYVHYFKDIYGADPKENSRYFSAIRVISRVRHLEGYRTIAGELAAIYREAHARGHHAAQLDPELIFPPD